MAADKKISELELAIAIQPTDFGLLVDSNVDYKWTFAQLLTFLSTNLVIGAKVSFGTSIPANTAGLNGDVYIKTDTNQFSQKISGVWTIVYTVISTAAADGTLLFGAGTPNNLLGNNGDAYVDTTQGIFYKKASGTWTLQFTMLNGPAGQRGNSVLGGTVDPTTEGLNGDYYVNTTTLTFFGPKAGGIWPTGIAIKGTNGNTILYGTGNPSNSLGNNGDFYLRTDNLFFFGPKSSGAWPAGVSIIGPSGADGIDGPTGPAGPSFDMTAYIAAAPTLANEAAAVTAGLASYTFYKTPTGELRYKLPATTGRVFSSQFTSQFS